MRAWRGTFLLAMTCLNFAVAAPISPLHLEARPGRPHAFVDDMGREIIFHGSSAVVKGPPWHPDHRQFSTDISMAREDFEWMQKLGLNFLRLGMMWPGLEPTRGDYNETYLDVLDAIITMGAEHGVYTMLDGHQDGLTEHFCGEGLPSWAVKRSVHHWYNPLSKPYPAPYDEFEAGNASRGCGNGTCFYVEPKHQNATFPKRQACDHVNHGKGWGESTFESSAAYQGLWSNWNGTGDAFASMWAHVAARFKGRPEVVGFNLVNEPFAGDMYHDPLLMVPYPSPTNADRVNLQPLYDRVNAAVRAIDEEVLFFVAGVTWGDLGSGFSAPPGGAAYGNRTVMSYHFYQPPQFSAKSQVDSHVAEAVRLGTAAMMTETEAIWAGSYNKNDSDITGACSAKLQGWADWAWKSFVREGPGDAESFSQYYEWGAPKTGHGMNWNGVNYPPAYYTTRLAQTYAPRVLGSITKMMFNETSSTFSLQYEVGSVDPGLATEIFLWASRYEGGAEISTTASVGKVRVEYNTSSSWVQVYAGSGLQVGACVTVDIAKKAS